MYIFEEGILSTQKIRTDKLIRKTNFTPEKLKSIVKFDFPFEQLDRGKRFWCKFGWNAF